MTTTLRLTLVSLVLGLSLLLGLWATGAIGGADVSEASARLAAIVAIGGVALSLVLALLSGRRPAEPGNSSAPPQNGPRF